MFTEPGKSGKPGKSGICLKFEGGLENLGKGKLFNKKPGKDMFFW